MVGVRVGCEICCCVGNAVGGEVGQVAKIIRTLHSNRGEFLVTSIGYPYPKKHPTNDRN